MTTFSWNSYQRPTMTENMDTALFYRPDDSKLPTGDALYSFLTDNGTATPDRITNRTVKLDGGLTREMLGNSTDFLNKQLGTGFGGLQSSLDQYAQYGGLFGNQGMSVYSPQSQNGYGTGQWGNNNPFLIKTGG